MMEKIRINFIDFWPGFEKNNNYFFKLLSKYYSVVISDEPEIIFYSNYGKDYLNYNCIRIYFSGENIRPDFSGCDFSMSFDFIDRENHYRLPLYIIYLGLQYFSGSLSKTAEALTQQRSREEIAAMWRNKKKFCCMVVSNPHSKKRINFFKRLSAVRHVDSGGRALNNIGGPIKDKLSFINDYKFVISFENGAYPGYVTEKILEPLSMGCIPIYWGSPLVEKDFNKKRFLNYDDFANEDELVKTIMKIDSDEGEALKLLAEPIFPDNEIPACIQEKNVIGFLNNIITNRNAIKPIARNTFQKQLHILKRRKGVILQLVKAKIGKNNT